MHDHSHELEKLTQEYLAKLPEKVSELHKLAEDAITALGKNAQPNWDTLELAAHKLAGSTGTYGFIALSKQLVVLEDALSLKEIQKLSSKKAALQLQQIMQKVQELTLAATQTGPNNKTKAA